MRLHAYLVTTPDLELYDLVRFELGVPARYRNTPPEVFPFGWMGVDGVHFGWVDRTPEIPAEDYPVANVAPMDSNTVYEVAASIPEAFLMEMSIWAENEDPLCVEDVKRIRDAAVAMGLSLIPEASRRMYGPEGNGHAISVIIPEGYRFVQAADNVGVLAPAETFQLKEEIDLLETAQWPEEHVARLAADLVDRFPGTALFHYKCLWWRSSPKELWAEGMRKSYLALGRPSLAVKVGSSA